MAWMHFHALAVRQAAEWRWACNKVVEAGSLHNLTLLLILLLLLYYTNILGSLLPNMDEEYVIQDYNSGHFMWGEMSVIIEIESL